MENKPKNSLLKWGALGIGVLLGVSHFSMIGLLSNRKTLPEINLPVGPYTSYEVEAGHDGYRISYKANDPKVMTVQKDVNKKGGFLGLGNNKTKVIEEYTVVGTQHIGGGNDEKKLSAAQVECIEAIGSEKEQVEWLGLVLGLLLLLPLLIFPLLGGFLLVLRQ